MKESTTMSSSSFDSSVSSTLTSSGLFGSASQTDRDDPVARSFSDASWSRMMGTVQPFAFVTSLWLLLVFFLLASMQP